MIATNFEISSKEERLKRDPTKTRISIKSILFGHGTFELLTSPPSLNQRGNVFLVAAGIFPSTDVIYLSRKDVHLPQNNVASFQRLSCFDFSHLNCPVM